MSWLNQLFVVLGRRRERRANARAAIDAEALAMIAAHGRSEALWQLREREGRPGIDSGERHRLSSLRTAVLRLSPRAPKADTATRMLYRDL